MAPRALRGGGARGVGRSQRCASSLRFRAAVGRDGGALGSDQPAARAGEPARPLLVRQLTLAVCLAAQCTVSGLSAPQDGALDAAAGGVSRGLSEKAFGKVKSSRDVRILATCREKQIHTKKINGKYYFI